MSAGRVWVWRCFWVPRGGLRSGGGQGGEGKGQAER